jgi:hypothetical protein
MTFFFGAARPFLRMAPLCLLLLVGAVQAQPGAVPSKERKLKAAYLPAQHAALLEAVRRLPVLTVCDTAAAFAACVVSVHADGARLRFHVARDEAALSRLHVSARLLAVAP